MAARRPLAPPAMVGVPLGTAKDNNDHPGVLLRVTPQGNCIVAGGTSSALGVEREPNGVLASGALLPMMRLTRDTWFYPGNIDRYPPEVVRPRPGYCPPAFLKRLNERFIRRIEALLEADQDTP